MYAEVIAIVTFAVDNWGAYDTWCLLHGFDPLEIPSRRMVNSIWAWMIEGLEPEKVQELIRAIQPDDYEAADKRQRRRVVPSPPPVAYRPNETTGKEQFRAPEGWKPPGYNEEKAYKASKEFMSAQRSGFKKGGE